MIIAITGYIGAGKTTTADFFKEHGFKVINVDELGHELIHEPEIREKIKAEFGVRVVDKDFTVDRAKLSKLVFNDADKLKRLNSIVHPHLKQQIRKKLGSEPGDVVLDVALFKELNLDDIVEKVILVQTDITKIYERLSSRYTKKEIVNIMNNQRILKSADFIIDNNGTIEELKKRVEQVVKKI